MEETKNLGLQKPGYDDDSDIVVINQNMDKIDKAITTLNATKLNIPIEIPASADLNTYNVPGMYYNGSSGVTILNTPINTSSFSLFVEKTGAWGAGAKQTFTSFILGTMFFRASYFDSTGAWSEWKPLATATPPQEFVLPASAGFSASGSSFSKDQNNRVHIGGQIKKTTGYIQSGVEVIMTLPNDCLPVRPTTRAIAVFGGGGVAVVDMVTGNVIPFFSPIDNIEVINFDISFIAK